ncbi:DUF2335 domain-containing protein [Faucicola atlantae]|nr:DUF2335 domain-containing protein [Moraxella atlantae]
MPEHDETAMEGEIVESSPEGSERPKVHSNNTLNLNAPFVPISHAQNVNIPAPAIPANDMVKLEAHLPGSIDRILRMSEKEQEFTHHIVQAQHDEQSKINNRNIEISKEQRNFNFIKLVMGFLLIIGLIGLSTYLFILKLSWGGSVIALAALVLAAVFILGYFPEKIFNIFRSHKSPDE